MSRVASLVVLLSTLSVPLLLVRGSPPGPVVVCRSGNSDCNVTNAYGTFPDRSTCAVAAVAFPATEQELLLAVSDASAKKQHMKAVTVYAHSMPKLSCPGGPSGQGLVISTARLNRTVNVDVARARMTFDAGITLRALLDAAAASGLALPHSPYWQGVTLGGLLSTGSHGSSVFGKGSAVHEYVVGMRLVVPSPVAVDGYYAKIISLGEELGRGAVGCQGFSRRSWSYLAEPTNNSNTQVTLQLEPMFKRSITNRIVSDDIDFEQNISSFAAATPYGDIIWYPSQAKVIYRDDFKLPITTKGRGLNDFLGFQAQRTGLVAFSRALEESYERTENAIAKCNRSVIQVNALILFGMGLKNNDGGTSNFTGYPVIGNQSDMQSAGSCLRSEEDELNKACGWDPRFRGLFYHQTTISIPFANITGFVADVKQLRDANPSALCGTELYLGFFMRFVRNSTAFLGKTEDAVDIDITYYRSRDPLQPRLFEDVLEEVEQMALFKYNGMPHWGKNRNIAFLGMRDKLGAKLDKFVDVMQRYDSEGLLSSDWSDAVLGLNGKEVVVEGEGCALEGLCICSIDDHCAPGQGYYCRAGQVYGEARVCRKVETTMGVQRAHDVSHALIV
ncbi:L-gulonolactone oxidase 2-like isoform X2 [Canna indica]|uniref:L-gulonolactone oxidase n=1 Tax=Canna indica TaxID=4628 RepID=A0AAQ3JZW6_9LILI|nr:L-gulonolactone oxidase 2-like isoform X2 [Canna indica]